MKFSLFDNHEFLFEINKQINLFIFYLKFSLSFSGCISSNECAYGEACIGRKCQNPCKECGPNTICELTENFGICKCFPGHKGNPYSYNGCRKFDKSK